MLTGDVWSVALTDPSELESNPPVWVVQEKKAKLKCSRCPKSNLGGSFERAFGTSIDLRPGQTINMYDRLSFKMLAKATFVQRSGNSTGSDIFIRILGGRVMAVRRVAMFPLNKLRSAASGLLDFNAPELRWLTDFTSNMPYSSSHMIRDDDKVSLGDSETLEQWFQAKAIRIYDTTFERLIDGYDSGYGIIVEDGQRRSLGVDGVMSSSPQRIEIFDGDPNITTLCSLKPWNFKMGSRLYSCLRSCRLATMWISLCRTTHRLKSGLVERFCLKSQRMNRHFQSRSQTLWLHTPESIRHCILAKSRGERKRNLQRLTILKVACCSSSRMWSNQIVSPPAIRTRSSSGTSQVHLVVGGWERSRLHGMASPTPFAPCQKVNFPP